MITQLLKRHKAFLETEVCQKVRFKRPDSEDALHFELVHPVVSLGWPEVRVGGADVPQRVPGIVIGLSGPVTDDGEQRVLPIELGLIVYSSGTVEQDNALSVDNTGYLDLLNFIDRTVEAVRNAAEVGAGMTLFDPEIKAQPENEQYLDFWMGVVAFTLCSAPGPRAAEKDLI
ncbi:MAG: hypothetical protein VB035_06145 [Candidatus Fimivivens sp.]|nr:hypothetical protein [Candidatus Fimivivens sp.]